MQSWSNKDILVVSPAPCLPRNFGNRLRIHRVCERLIEAGARVHFLLYPAEADWRHVLPLDMMQAHTQMFASFHLVPPTRALHTGANGAHHLRDEWWDPALGTYMDWLTRVQRFDAAIVNYTWLSRALLHLPPSCLKILDTHDRFSGRKEMFIANGLEPEFFYTQPEEEAAALDRADVVWAIKREEAEFFRTLTEKPVVTVPHIDKVTPLATAPGPFLRVGIIGANNNLNRQNFETFLDAAVAHVRRTLSQFELVVAGSVCKVLRPRQEKFIRFLGYVDRTEDFYSAVDAVVVPMRFSTGLKIKTAEALAFGKPVLALDHAFEGFYPINALHRLNSHDEILAGIDLLIRDSLLLEDLGHASLISAAASEREVERGFEQTLHAFDPLQDRTFWLVVNADELAALPVLADHLRETLAYLVHLFPSVGVAFAGPGIPPADLCMTLAEYGPLVIVTEAPQEVNLSGLPARVQAVSPGQVLGHIAGAWVATRYGLDLLSSLPSGLGFAAFDALALSHALDPAATDADLIATLASHSSGQVLCAMDLDFDGLAELVAAGWDFVLLPWLKVGEQADFLSALRARPRLTEDVVLTAPAFGPGRTLIDSRLWAARTVAAQSRTGRAARYRLTAPNPPALLLEYVLRLGARVALAGDPAAPDLNFVDIESALRNDAGWSRIWTLGAELVARLGLTPRKRTAEAGAQPDEAFASPQTDPDPLASAGAKLGFTRLMGISTLAGDDLHFSQLMIYRPKVDGLDAVDVQIMNAQIAGRDFNRLILRFFFIDDKVNLFVRRNDCSLDAFLDPASVWQEDDWGPFVIYKLDGTLASAYRVGLAGHDHAVLAEALNLALRVHEPAQSRLEGDLLERWNRIARVLATCDLRAPPAPPPSETEPSDPEPSEPEHTGSPPGASPDLPGPT